LRRRRRSSSSPVMMTVMVVVIKAEEERVGDVVRQLHNCAVLPIEQKWIGHMYAMPNTSELQVQYLN
jgi:hypothetical protein